MKYQNFTFYIHLFFICFINYIFTHPPITFPLFCFGKADAPPDNTIISPISNNPLSFKFSIPKFIVSSIEPAPSINTGNVPNHIKTNSKDYLYPHNYPNSWVKQEYMPSNLKGKIYYHPRNNKVEQNLNKLHKEMRSE